jgi:LPXTG-motif cell wall-anchored protein
MTSHRPDPARARAGRSRLAAGRAFLAAAWLGIVAAGAALGASAAPSADPGPDPLYGNIEAWLDVPIPADATVGEPFAFGVTMWDTTTRAFPQFNGGYVRLHPAKGTAKPTVGEANSDWPGHLIAEVVIPKGGPGELEVGLSESACTTRGSVQTCDVSEYPFRMAGTGPPPDAPLTSLLVARTQPPVGSILAGQPFDIRVTLEPQGQWDMDALHLPDQLIAFANARGGPDLANAGLNDTGERGTSPSVTYLGQMTIDEPGEVTVQVAIPGNGTEDQVLPGATIRLQVGGSGTEPRASARPAPGSPAAPATGEDGPPWLVIGAVVAGLAGLGLAIRKGFADL